MKPSSSSPFSKWSPATAHIDPLLTLPDMLYRPTCLTPNLSLQVATGRLQGSFWVALGLITCGTSLSGPVESCGWDRAGLVRTTKRVVILYVHLRGVEAWAAGVPLFYTLLFNPLYLSYCLVFPRLSGVSEASGASGASWTPGAPRTSEAPRLHYLIPPDYRESLNPRFRVQSRTIFLEPPRICLTSAFNCHNVGETQVIVSSGSPHMQVLATIPPHDGTNASVDPRVVAGRNKADGPLLELALQMQAEYFTFRGRLGVWQPVSDHKPVLRGRSVVGTWRAVSLRKKVWPFVLIMDTGFGFEHRACQCHRAFNPRWSLVFYRDGVNVHDNFQVIV